MSDRRPRAHAERRPRRHIALVTLVLWMLALIGSANAQSTDAAAAASAPPSTPSRLSASLLTVGPGELFFERFGHNAIVLRDDASNEAVAYNYGMFDFDESDFLANFARGHMRYRLIAGDLADDLAMYRAERREILEQHLDLSPQQTDELARFLEWNARPENALYRYDYFTANCSTRVRDALDRALGGALLKQSEGRSRGYTYRADALRLMAPEKALMLLIDLGLGPFADQRLDYWQESFVPETLAHVVAGAQIADDNGKSRPLTGAAQILARGDVEEPPALPPDLRWPFLFAGCVIALALLWLSRRETRAARIGLATFATVFELACAIGGLVMLFLWFGSEHVAAWRNENLLLLNPLCLLLVPVLWLRAAPTWMRAIAWLVVGIAGFALFSKILPWFVQANLHWIVLLLPIHLALALAMRPRRAPGSS